ncbi:MFS transporter [Desulfurococcaceae archaeon MEX13E-LK6-19]|nr:MFS transporter [Desulfurococcaceae archaeon MEX13E-LK6-19]
MEGFIDVVLKSSGVRRGLVDKSLLLVSLVNGIGFGFSWAVLAPYLRILGVSGSIFGLMSGGSVFVASFSTLLAGILCDVYGSKRIASIGLVLYGLSFFLFSTRLLHFIAMGYLLLGFSSSLVMTSINVLTSRSVDDSMLHYSFSYVRASRTLGSAAGSFLGWIPVILSMSLGIDLALAYGFSLLALTPIMIANVFLVARVRERSFERMGSPSLGEIFRGIRGLGRFNYLIVIGSLIGFGAAMSIHNIGYYFAAKYGVTSGEIGSIFGLQQLAMAFIMTRLPVLADKYGGPLRIYLAATIPSIPLLIAMTLVDDYLAASTIYLVRSILMNVANPLYTAFALSLVPNSRRGIASGLLSLSRQLPAGAGRAIGGYLLDIDLELPLRLTAILYTVSLVVLALLFEKEWRRKQLIISA